MHTSHSSGITVIIVIFNSTCDSAPKALRFLNRMQKMKGGTSWLIQQILGLMWKSRLKKKKKSKISNRLFQSNMKLTWRKLQQREKLSFLHFIALCVTSTVMLCGFHSTFWLQHSAYCFRLTMYVSRQPKAQR